MNNLPSSTRKVVHDCEYASITHFVSRKALEIVWRDFTPSRYFRPIFAELAEALRSSGKPHLWLCDHTAAKIIAPEDQAWLLGDWLDSLRDSGAVLAVRRLAVVQATDLFGRLSVTNLSTRLARRCARLDLHVFDGRADAVTWLGL
jgi:hypothetical protein